MCFPHTFKTQIKWRNQCMELCLTNQKGILKKEKKIVFSLIAALSAHELIWV